ncbi:late control protein [Sphingobium sp. SCG-1]|nr:late control protein [Sphingobium sp. SCG-1]
MPIAAWRVTLDGQNLTDKMGPRLISLTIAEKRGDEADQLDIVLHDADGLLEIPKSGAKLRVALGWKQGTGLPVGLIDKGEFKVDEASFSGPPDIVTIRARSADLTDNFRVRKERSFVGKTVKTIVSAIAGDNGLTPKIDDSLGAKVIPALGAGAKSDAALLRALGKRFDAVATVKAGTLIFAPIGKGATSGGTALPTETLDRKPTERIEYSRVERDQHDGVEATWHDKATGTRKTVKSGHTGQGKPKRIRKTHASETDAQQAAEAENGRMNRAKAKASYTLAYGRPDIFPERPVKLTGVKAEIAEHNWLVAECSHRMDGQGGLTSAISLESS